VTKFAFSIDQLNNNVLASAIFKKLKNFKSKSKLDKMSPIHLNNLQKEV